MRGPIGKCPWGNLTKTVQGAAPFSVGSILAHPHLQGCLDLALLGRGAMKAHARRPVFGHANCVDRGYLAMLA